MASPEHQCIQISGMGVVSAAGKNLSECLSSMANMERHAGPADWVGSSLKGPFFDVSDVEEASGKMRTLCLLEKALDQALEQAKLIDPDSYRVGIALGTTVASQLNDLGFYAAYLSGQEPDLHSIDTFLEGNLAEAVARKLGVSGPMQTVVNACSSGADAIGMAYDWLRAGVCDIAIAGGADELNRIPISGFHALGVSSSELCAPFDRDRQGLNLGEGAGVVVMETQAQGERRGVSSSLRLCGYGASSDAYHLTSPHPEGAGLSRAISFALQQAGIDNKQIAFINAHGTATRENDKVEGAVLATLMPGVPVVSTKAYTGHTLGAAGAIEAIFSAASLQIGWIPGNAGFCNKDDEIPMTPVSEKTQVTGAFALSTSLAFGGNNAALVLKCEGKEA